MAPWRATTLRGPHWADATPVGRILPRELGIRDAHEYSGVSNANLVLIVGAAVYFLMPVDLVPDFIVGLGFADDAAVIAWVVHAVRDELAKFKACHHEKEKTKPEH